LSKPTAKSWPKIAAQVGERIPAVQFHSRVTDWLAKNARDDEKWAVAVSGGLDSVALLILLWIHFPKKRKNLLVLHYDHAVRPDSASDAQFVEALSKNLKVPFITERRPPGGAQNEKALRDARLIFFRKHQIEHKARIIFFGHQRDDIAESMLMRLARGSGASGLCSPRPVHELPNTVVSLRPLLDLTHDELCKALADSGATWREDSTNAQPIYLRNRIRLQVMPVWRAAVSDRNLEAGVARSRTALEDDAEALEDLTEKVMHDLPEGAPLTLARLAGQPRAICRRALWWWLTQNGFWDNLNLRSVETLLDAIILAQPGRWSAGPGRWIVLDGAALSFTGGTLPGTETSWGPLALKVGQTLALPGGANITARVIAVDRKLLKELKSGKINPSTNAYLALSAKSKDPTLQVRSWQTGDRYRPLGAPGRRKLQDLFTDKKIPLKERHRLPVVCTEDNEPVWVPGFPPAHGARVAEATRTALGLTYQP